MDKIAQIISSKHRVYGLTFDRGDKKFFYFLEVEHDKEEKFIADLEDENKKVLLHEYGKIIEEGVAPPSPELVAGLKEKYKLIDA